MMSPSPTSASASPPSLDESSKSVLRLTSTTSSSSTDSEQPASSVNEDFRHHHLRRRRHPSVATSSSPPPASPKKRDDKNDDDKESSLPASSLNDCRESNRPSSPTAVASSTSMKLESNSASVATTTAAVTGHSFNTTTGFPSSSHCTSTDSLHPPPLLSKSCCSSSLIQTPSVTSSAASSLGSQDKKPAPAAAVSCESGSRERQSVVLGSPSSNIVSEGGGGTRGVTTTSTGVTTVVVADLISTVPSSPQHSVRNKRNEVSDCSSAAATSSQSTVLSPNVIPPPPASGGNNSSTVRQMSTLKRFLSTLHHFTCEISPEVGEKVHSLVFSLVTRVISVEDFLHKVQVLIRFPVRPYVLPFLQFHLPILQTEVSNAASALKLTPSEYLRQNESLIFDPVVGRSASSSSSSTPLHYYSLGSHFSYPPSLVGEAFDIFQATLPSNPIFSHPPPQYPYQPISPPTPAHTPNNMGVKENGVASKRRFSPPDSRKENGVSDTDKDIIEVVSVAKRPSSSVSQISQHHSSSRTTPSISSHPHLVHHLNPLHPIHANGSVNTSTLIQSQLNVRAALLESGSLVDATSNGYRVMNGSCSPKDISVNGRNTQSRPLESSDQSSLHHRSQHQTQQQPNSDRVYEREVTRSASVRSPNLAQSLPQQQQMHAQSSRSPRDEPPVELDDQFKNIYTMLNCILGMVDKTKQALSMIQQRSVESRSTSVVSNSSSSSPPGVRGGAAAVVSASSSASGFPSSSTRLVVSPGSSQDHASLPPSVSSLSDHDAGHSSLVSKPIRSSDSPPVTGVANSIKQLQSIFSSHGQNCWNCGRKANETCSGCNIARYCGSFCQHKDWDSHHRVCGQSGSSSTASSLTVNTRDHLRVRR